VLSIARKIAVATAAAGCMLAALPAGNAAASAGRTVFSADQAGYSVTGARFYGGSIWARLPDAGRFSGHLGRVGVSVQLWTRHLVFDLTVSACADKACSPGGRPVTSKYRPVLAIYHRSTHALVCSTAAASAASRCPGATHDWPRCRIPPGQTASLSLSYYHPTGRLYAVARGQHCTADIGGVPGTGLVVNQVRIAAQFGATPWSPGRIRAPRHAERVITLGTPPPPPYFAEVGIYTTQFHGACIAARWKHHAIALTANGARSPAQAAPTGWRAHGCDFGINLQPRRR
jgi:hypothetical protein